MRVGITAFILCFMTLGSLQAQRAHLVFSIDTTAPFQLFIDGLLESEQADTFHVVRNMPSGEHFVKIVFSNARFISFDQPVNIKKEGTYYYLIKPKDPDNPRWFEIDQVDFDKEMKLPKKSAPIQPEKPIPAPSDSLTTENPPSDSTYTSPTPKDTVEDKSSVVDSTKGFCATPLDPRKHQEFVSRISALNFDDKKLSLAKDFASQNCFTAVQVMETMQSFDFEDTKLDFAQFAYPRCFDAENYLFVEDILEFETSKKTLRSNFEYRTE